MLKILALLGLSVASLNVFATSNNVNDVYPPFFAGINTTADSVGFQCNSSSPIYTLNRFMPCKLNPQDLPIFTNTSTSTNLKLSCLWGNQIQTIDLLPGESAKCQNNDVLGIIFSNTDELNAQLKAIGVNNVDQLATQN